MDHRIAPAGENVPYPVPVAECRANPPEVTEPIDVEVAAPIVDAAGDVVAVFTATWRLAPPA